ncbi:MAG: M48 family metalloprotease [Nitrospira sp.]|nr:M48 family metalloprotease [Nitrospira sp.]
MRNRWICSLCLVACSLLLVSCKELEQATKIINNPTLTEMVEKTKKAADALLPIGYEAEIAIGQAIALQVVSRYGGVVNNPALTEYVNLVGLAVAHTCDRPDIPYYFAVLNHDSINAFAAPGGYVFVTSGLIKQVRNEAELAAVLGHEIAHVSKKHILDVIQRSKQLTGATEAGLSFFKQDPSKFKGVVDEAVKKLLDEGLDQGKEIEADQVGDVFAARVGYDPTAYVAFLSRLRTIKGDDLAFFKTHPSFSTRIQAVQQTLQENGLKPNGVLLQERFAKSSKRT